MSSYMPTRFGCSYVLVCVNDSASGGKRIVMSSMLSLFEPGMCLENFAGMCLENFAEVSIIADRSFYSVLLLHADWPLLRRWTRPLISKHSRRCLKGCILITFLSQRQHRMPRLPRLRRRRRRHSGRWGLRRWCMLRTRRRRRLC